MNENMHNRYSTMKFPKYEYREYPKMLHFGAGKDKKSVTVNDADEEAAARAQFGPKAPEPQAASRSKKAKETA